MISAGISSVLDLRRGRPLCDACLSDYLGFRLRQIGAAVARMARRGLVRRFDGRCSGCCVTRRVAADVDR